jgi:hypothetical protein
MQWTGLYEMVKIRDFVVINGLGIHNIGTVTPFL